ncbi:hypothetical protein BDW02DRAFT_566978 [Decorospora gaudefroyi]|uniref:Uncharacterized protein n=1 Tax=Decorospora gaudefroyi TaxID=184978 RepID=A0A6A5KHE5_9PLEO|nr:hypothetical protein BDW02DRAFT_566978 [Decorospora gaudefroyi]
MHHPNPQLRFPLQPGIAHPHPMTEQKPPPPEEYQPTWTHEELISRYSSLRSAYTTLQTRIPSAATAQPFQLERAIHNQLSVRLRLEHVIYGLERRISEILDTNNGLRSSLEDNQAVLQVALHEATTESPRAETGNQNELNKLPQANENPSDGLAYWGMHGDQERCNQLVKDLQGEINALHARIRFLENDNEFLKVQADEARIDQTALSDELDALKSHREARR